MSSKFIIALAGGVFCATMGQAEQALTFGDPVLSTQSAVGKAFPGVFGASNAFIAPGGTVYGSVTYVTPRGGIEGNGADGDMSLGMAFGNPIDAVGVSVGVDITSVDADDFGDSGGFAVSASRALSVSAGSATFAGLSASNLGAWGDSTADDEKYAAYVSHLTSAGSLPLMITGGYMTDNTRDVKTGVLDDGAFLGMGLGLTQNLAASVSATETQMNLGMSATVPGLNGVSISTGVYDVTDNTNRRQFALTVGFAKSGLFGQ